MLPVLLLDIADVTARVAIYEGYNDNVVETRPAPDLPSERRGSPFTGLDLQLGVANEGELNAWSLGLGARGQRYTPFSDTLVGGNDYALSLGWNAGWQTSQNSRLSAGQSAMLADQNTARLADMPILGLDPSQGRQTFVFATSDIGWAQELYEHTRLRMSIGGALRYMLHETAPNSPGRGIDYGGPRAQGEWSHDLGPVDTGGIRLNLGMWYMPRSLLDLEGRRGPSETWQATPAVVWGHALSDAWSSEIVGGVSFATTENEVFYATSVAPAISAQLSYSEDEQFALLSYGLGINTDSIALGPGLSHMLGAQYGGPLGRTRMGRRWVAGASTRMARATIPVSSTSSFVAMTAGVGGIIRYAIGDWLGIVAGYEGQYLGMGQSAQSGASTVFYRNVVYVGLSGSVSTMAGGLPLDVPRAPPR